MNETITRLFFRITQCWLFGAHWRRRYHDDRGAAGHWTCLDCGYDSPEIVWPCPPQKPNKKTPESNKKEVSSEWTWVYDEVPTYMGRDKYFVVVTTGGLRFIAWIENGEFITYVNCELIMLHNVACWMLLPDIPLQTTLTELAQERARKQNEISK